jgi:flagellar hook protein FlgE
MLDSVAGMISQVASARSASSGNQDGFGAGTLQSVSIGSDGVIEGTFSNGKTAKLGQIALANFGNPQGLMRTERITMLQLSLRAQPRSAHRAQ